MRSLFIPILYEDAPIVQEIKNEPPSTPSTPRKKKLADYLVPSLRLGMPLIEAPPPELAAEPE
ncbi:hypothetical protein [Nostoc sp. NMS4]|uniref:hypothetical protein n=1 Tax=Nostoc sp. NMS4 TaxID=2815390 RepID=UPI0025EEAC30|nr:hypothetical protein [Nostoc sp. NMS4]MBN3922723.1 hypothetical protein [Nostoc sp. NMS4]